MKFCVYTLGCKVNYYESEAIINKLKEYGDTTTTLELADVYVINTCAVTNEAEHKSRGIIAKINKINPNAKIYIMGCSSRLHRESYVNRPNVKAVLGTSSKEKIVDAILSDFTGLANYPEEREYNDNFLISGNRIRSFIKIQDGCNNFCTYCIIPYTRGRERSRTLSSISNELDIVTKNSLEVVLVGINIAGYGKDLTPQCTLVDVVNLFKKYPAVRLRFSSFEMGTLTDELLSALQKLPAFCPFFHLALQSGDDSTLKKMNRKYTTAEYMQAVEKIRSYFPNATISTDIIVGFPTETEEEFNNSLDFVKKCNFAFMHIFPYSKRDGTVAEKWGILNGSIVKNRVAKMTELEVAQKNKFLKENIGVTDEVLIETTQNGFLEGYTKGYIKCYIKSDCTALINKVVNVRLIEPFKDGMKGEIIYE